MRLPLYLEQVGTAVTSADGRTAEFTIRFTRCRNCGRPAAITDPCGFDHLGAVMEFAHTFANGDPQ